MDVRKILADLRQQRDQVEEVIVSLERLALIRESRRGRPPAIMTIAKRRGRPPGSKNRSRKSTASRTPKRIAVAAERAMAASHSPSPLLSAETL
jgi:hypothetical protein